MLGDNINIIATRTKIYCTAKIKYLKYCWINWIKYVILKFVINKINRIIARQVNNTKETYFFFILKVSKKELVIKLHNKIISKTTHKVQIIATSHTKPVETPNLGEYWVKFTIAILLYGETAPNKQ